MPLTPSPLNRVAERIIGAALRVHRGVGPGLLESIYEECLTLELLQDGLKVDRQVPFPIVYNGITMEKAFRIDLMVDDSVVVEVKSIDRILRVHQAQVLSYLRFTGRRLGLLFNFNVRWLMSDGFKRIVNHLESTELADPQPCL